MTIRVTPIAFESFGVRSMCTSIETDDIRILIDAGLALGPRFRMLPHPREYKARNLCRAKIREYAAKADVLVVSHYHNDHHTPNYTETVWLGSSPEESEQIYKDKSILMKDIRSSINFSQRRRGWMFQRFAKKIGGKCQEADGKTFEFGATKVKFSNPLPHGEEDTDLGWVIMTILEAGGEKVIHTSDVQGPPSKRTSSVIRREKPDILILCGPPIYLEEYKVERSTIQRAIENAALIATETPALIIDHHMLRSNDWRDRAAPIYKSAAEANNKVLTAAEFLDIEPALLESQREQMYKEDPPSEEFIKWTRLPNEKRRKELPPI